MAAVRAVALDFDGVLTDGTFWWGTDGAEYKRLSFVDIMGISIGRKAGLVFALISGEDSPLLDRYAKKMGIQNVYKGCKDKAAALRSFVMEHDLKLTEVCFMGDDVNDLSAMELSGISAAPSTAHESVRRKAKLVMQKGGGRGAVRELLDTLLSENDPSGTALPLNT